MWRRIWQPEAKQITWLFLALLLLYLAIAWMVLAPRGYYGTTEQPRFADPWIARTETLLGGGVLYRDTFTATPPLTNFLLVPPSVVSGWFDHLNPWSTLSFQVWFSLFNLFAALALLAIGETRREGLWAAAIYLLNPLTFGNTVLRRQDESVVVFFFALTLALFLRRRHVSAAVALGAGILVKLTALLLLPLTFLHSRDWRYVIVPPAVFAVVFAPFMAAAGRSAFFWDFSQQDTQHPFQLGGVSLGALWNRYHPETASIPVDTLSLIFLAAAALSLMFVAWKRYDILVDGALLVAIVLLFTPKLHTGYFSILALFLAPLVRRTRLTALYLVFGAVAIVADMYKWPIEDFRIAFALMLIVTLCQLIFVARLVVWGERQRRAAS
jgi:hypothetical protein